jgi:hypothetical protein
MFNTILSYSLRLALPLSCLVWHTLVLEEEEVDGRHERAVTGRQLLLPGDMPNDEQIIPSIAIIWFLGELVKTVIFLYLMDNDTSWMILFSSGIGRNSEGGGIVRGGAQHGTVLFLSLSSILHTYT